MQPINRALLKENAKVALKRNFWMIMLVIFVGGLLQVSWSGLGGSSAGFNFGSSSVTPKQKSQINEMMDEDVSLEEAITIFGNELCNELGISQGQLIGGIVFFIVLFVILIIIIAIVSFIIQFIFGTFLYAPAGVGYRLYFMKNRHGIATFSDLFGAFGKGKYMKTVKAMFSTNIRIWAWNLLFYFPGLVKYYQYYFVPYIMAENPEISGERAREISRKMTDGHKWQMYVLGLSFLGWIMLFILIEIVLALVSCGLLAIPGALLALPIGGYEAVTYAELYAERREYALASGIASPSELVGFVEE